MSDNLSVAETREMSKTTIKRKLSERVKRLEELGMDHVTACEFVSGIMNLGISAQEKWHNQNREL